jgi:RimJ/RimL family protein N-acetyltransferase
MEPIVLPSGRVVLIRPITAEDGPALSAAYDRLSPESKYRRFLAPKPHLTSSDTRYLVQIDGRDHVALIATPAEEPNYILGVGRFVRLPEEPEQAELAVVVGDPYQQEGLATALLERLTIAATERGITSFKATMLAGNEAAHRLIRSASGRVASERHLGPVDELEIELAS